MLQDKIGQLVRFFVVVAIAVTTIMVLAIFHCIDPLAFRLFIFMVEFMIIMLSIATFGLFPLAMLGFYLITRDWVIGTYPTATSAEQLDKG